MRKFPKPRAGKIFLHISDMLQGFQGKVQNLALSLVYKPIGRNKLGIIAPSLGKSTEDIRQELAGFDSAASLLNINPAFQPDLIQMINQKQACLPGRDIVLKGVEKAVIDQAQITVFVKTEKLSRLINDNLHIAMPQIAEDKKEIIVPYITRRAHRGAIVIQPDKPDADKDPLDLPSGELRNLVRGLIWRDEHFGGMTLRDIAKRESFSEGYVGQCIFKTFDL